MAKYLHHIIAEVLQQADRPLSVHDIVKIISEKQLWSRPKDEESPPYVQVSARIDDHPEIFVRENGLIRLIPAVMLANITWNPMGWRSNYINPKAGHEYARTNIPGESLNFNLNKKTIDSDKYVHGFFQYTLRPKGFHDNGLIIFYTRNTDVNQGQIVGIYGRAVLLPEAIEKSVPFQNEPYPINIKAERDFSLLFPVPLAANNYKLNSKERFVGQVGYTYKDIPFAERVLFDELTESVNAGVPEEDFKKLLNVYEYYTGKGFSAEFLTKDEKEQKELVAFIAKTKSREYIINDLKNLQPFDPDQVTVNHKTYKRDNKTIAELKILRDFKCQICKTSILKKDGSKYVEAAHITPKFQKGAETPDNIILLCPNHHKEFDHGNRIIVERDTDQIIFDLNGTRHIISLRLTDLF